MKAKIFITLSVSFLSFAPLANAAQTKFAPKTLCPAEAPKVAIPGCVYELPDEDEVGSLNPYPWVTGATKSAELELRGKCREIEVKGTPLPKECIFKKNPLGVNDDRYTTDGLKSTIIAQLSHVPLKQGTPAYCHKTTEDEATYMACVESAAVMTSHELTKKPTSNADSGPTGNMVNYRGIKVDSSEIYSPDAQ